MRTWQRPGRGRRLKCQQKLWTGVAWRWFGGTYVNVGDYVTVHRSARFDGKPCRWCGQTLDDNHAMEEGYVGAPASGPIGNFESFAPFMEKFSSFKEYEASFRERNA